MVVPACWPARRSVRSENAMLMKSLPYYAEQKRECALFETAWRQRLPLLIKGPTGCGKTRFVEHMAQRLGRAGVLGDFTDQLQMCLLPGLQGFCFQLGLAGWRRGGNGGQRRAQFGRRHGPAAGQVTDAA